MRKGRYPFITRIVISLIVVAALGIGIYQTVFSYAHNGYFLDQKNGQLVIMSGRIGGVLIWEPELDTETGIDYKNLTPSDKLLVTRHTRFNTRKDALKMVEKARLDSGKTKSQQDPFDYLNSTTTSTTTTVVADPNAIVIPPPTNVGGQ